MAAAVQPYMAQITTTAAQAEQAAIQARTAAAAYETALTASVPPPLVAANRAQLGQLLSTNVLGQDTAAIAANEAQYGEMWAQDATAMYGYAGQSAAATKVTPFTSAPAIAKPAAQTAQTAAATSAGSTQSTLTQLVSGLPNQLQGLASPLAATSNGDATSPLTEIWFLLAGQTSLPTNIGTFLSGYNNYSSFFYNTEGLPYFSVGGQLSGRLHNYSDVTSSHTSIRLREMVPLTKGAACHEPARTASPWPKPSAQNSKPARVDIRHRIPKLCGPGSCSTRPKAWATTRSPHA